MNFRRLVAVPLVVASLSVLVPRAAAAQTSAVDQATARALTIEGYDALDKKDYAKAVDRFERADKLYHVPTVAIGLGHAQLGMGRLVAALSTYSTIVREGVPAGGPPAFGKAVEEARKGIEAITPRIPSVVISVRGPADPQVTIDGSPVPAAALGVKRPVDPGKHIVRAAGPGFEASEQSFTVAEGKVETLSFDLKAGAAPLVVAPLPVVAPIAPPPVAPPVEPPPPPAGRSTQKVVGIVGLGLGGAGLAVGAITGGLALSKHSSLVSQCSGGHCYDTQKAALSGDVDSYHTLGTVSTAGFIAGGVLAAGGLVLVLTSPKGSVAPVVGPSYFGARGTF